MKKTIQRILAVFAAASLCASMAFAATAEDDVQQPRGFYTIQMLPRQYPDGSHYSTTTEPCVCHNGMTCNSPCTCVKYKGASQCIGFAQYCYYMYNDCDVPYNNASKYYSLSSDANMRNFLEKVGNQCYVRGQTANGTPHAVFIVSSSTRNKTVTVYDCNMDGQCGVSFGTYSYSEFRDHMYSVRFCYTADQNVFEYKELAGE